GVVYGVGDCGGDAREADLADPASAELVDLFVRKVEKVDVDWRRVEVHCHDVISEVAVDRRAVLRIVTALLKQLHPNSHHDRTLNLITASKWIQNSTGIDHRHHTAHA